MINRLDIAIFMACLGTGVVVAVPRHLQLSAQAREADVTALARGAATAAELAHSRWLATGRPATIAGSRGVVAMTNGYPSAATLSLMLAEAETAAFLHDGGTFRHAGLRPGTPCDVAYEPPPAPGEAPIITARTAGC